MITWQFVTIGGITFVGLMTSAVLLGVRWKREEREDEEERRSGTYYVKLREW